MGSEWSCSWNYNYNEPTLHFKLSKSLAHRWNYLPPWPFTVWTLPKLVCLLPQKVIKCFWIESFLHQISNWRYFGLGVIWEWNRLQISPSATCSVIFVSAASSFLFLFLLPLPLPSSYSFSPTSDVLLTSLDIYLTMSFWFCGFVIWWVAWCLTAAMSSQISSSRWARSRQPEPQITLTRCVGVFNLSFLIMNILNHRRDGLNQ